MSNLQLIRSLVTTNNTKIVLLVMDGLGGLPLQPGGPTELEAAHTPTLDRLATEGTLGQIVPVRTGITPGSGPAHLALFGIDPIEHAIGRGVIEAFGVGLPVGEHDVAARGNFCTVDAAGLITDRRAGRISTAAAEPLVEKLKAVRIPGVEVELRHVKEYRFAMVMRGVDLNADIADTDPQIHGVAPLPVREHSPGSARAASFYNQWIAAAQPVLRTESAANMFTLRGFSGDPRLPKFAETYKLRAACAAMYPMYRGVARLVGMQVQDVAGASAAAALDAVRSAWAAHDFFFVHIKPTDSHGEDGDFNGKQQIIETVDAMLPALLDLKPDVLLVTGDHSTPASMQSHSWHPVPFLLWAPATHRPDRSTRFGERECASGGLGTLPATDVMPLALAHAQRLAKYGA